MYVYVYQNRFYNKYSSVFVYTSTSLDENAKNGRKLGEVEI